jgi:transposase
VTGQEQIVVDYARLKEAYLHLEAVNAQLRFQIEYLKKKLFGCGQSEKADLLQAELALEGIEQKKKVLEKMLVAEHERQKRAEIPSRKERYENVPVKETIEILPEEVKANPDAYERTEAFEETFELDIDLPKVYRRRIVRPKFRNKDNREQPLVIAKAPVRVVEGLVAANLLAWILVSKFVDHLPLNRQARMLKRYGCEFSLESMVRWVERGASWIEPIYQMMSLELLEGDYLQVDETPVTFCDPDAGIKKVSKGYFCVYSRPGAESVFVWSTSRSYEDVTGHLKTYRGLLQSDAYSSYLKLEREYSGIILLGCMAHTRRKFVEARESARRECDLVINLMKRLYKVEKEIRTSKTPLSEEKIKTIRQKQSTNTLLRIKRVIYWIAKNHNPQHPARKAADYAIANWTYLTRYIDYGKAQIDNNLVENTIRPTAVGKKNWLFIGHPNAGQRAAVLYSILISCERFGINPQNYLRMLFSQDLQILTTEQKRALIPSNYARTTLALPARQ